MMNMIDAISGGDVLKHEKVLGIEYNTIYIKLLMNKEQAIFTRRMNDNHRREVESQNKRRR